MSIGRGKSLNYINRIWDLDGGIGNIGNIQGFMSGPENHCLVRLLFVVCGDPIAKGIRVCCPVFQVFLPKIKIGFGGGVYLLGRVLPGRGVGTTGGGFRIGFVFFHIIGSSQYLKLYTISVPIGEEKAVWRFFLLLRSIFSCALQHFSV